jgi:hypothetical protein
MSCVRARALRGVLVAGCLLALAGCGGGGGGTSSPTAVGGSSNPGPTSPARQLAQQIKARLQAAGYVVHDVKLPTPFVRGPLDQAALAHGPQQTFVAVDTQTNQTYARLQTELVTITKTAHARAVKNLPTTPETFKRLEALSANFKALAHREFNVYVFNSADDASSYGKTNFETQNAHVLTLPGVNDLDKYETVGAVIYFMPVPENNGKLTFDSAGFEKLVRVAQGRT